LNRIKVGVIGTGHLGRFHALNYAQIPEAELVGVTDLDTAKAEAVAQEAHCRPYPDPLSLLKNVQAVSIAVPTDRHHAVGLEVLRHRVHCLIEKPIARTLEEADELVGLGRQNRSVLNVGHVERFNPAIQALQGYTLCPQFIEAHRLAQFNPRGTEVSVILDLMIHDIDIALHLVGAPVRRVEASGVAVVSQTADIANARILFENGAVANLTASRISQKKMRKTRLFQRDAYISVDFLDKVAEVYSLESGEAGTGMVLAEIGVGGRKKRVSYRRLDVPEKGGLRLELEAFLQAIRGEPSPAVTGEEGRGALAVAMTVLDRMET
jgi:predicted dehydrogenase